MLYKCPYCNTTHSAIDWDVATMQTTEETIHDIESIQMSIPGYSYVCPTCGAETSVQEIPVVEYK